MKSFTGWEYLLIDVANHWGLDKELFETRIQWATDNLDSLESLAEERGQWKDLPMYRKAVMAIRRAQRGEPIGHLVGFDAVCSGMQIMSAITGCQSGANATGLVDPNRRADAYTDCTKIMTDELGYHIEGERKKVKNAVMTSLYGSKKEPKKEFGEDTPELNAFYKAMMKMAPGPCMLLEALVQSWQPFAEVHEWLLPDGFHARVKVMARQETRIEVDELAHSTFTYVWYENEGCERDVKNAANVIHSIDAYVLRSLVRRCNYDPERARFIYNCVQDEIIERAMGTIMEPDEEETPEVAYYRGHYERSLMPDPVIIDYLDRQQVCYLSSAHLKGLQRILRDMLSHDPFEVVTVHDDFKCHPNHMNQLRFHYKEILADLADSQIISDILSQIYGKQGTFPKLTNDLSKDIRNSNYALC